MTTGFKSLHLFHLSLRYEQFFRLIYFLEKRTDGRTSQAEGESGTGTQESKIVRDQADFPEQQES